MRDLGAWLIAPLLSKQGLLENWYARGGEDRQGPTLKSRRAIALQSQSPVDRAVPECWEEVSDYCAADKDQGRAEDDEYW